MGFIWRVWESLKNIRERFIEKKEEKNRQMSVLGR